MLQNVALPRTVPAMPAKTLKGCIVRLVPQVAEAVACSSCCLKGVCLPCELGQTDLDLFNDMAIAKRRISRGSSLFHGGDRFESLYAVHSGAFKSVGTSRQGEEKITGFHLSGELLGLEAINHGRHSYSAVALEDSEVCVIPFPQLEKMAMSVPALQHQLLRVLSSDISRDDGLMLLLGSMAAEQRLAAFLMSLSRRHQRLGFSATHFILRMTREEIGSYLGLTLETVSRLLSRFQREGLVTVQQRNIDILDTDRLREMMGQW